MWLKSEECRHERAKGFISIIVGLQISNLVINREMEVHACIHLEYICRLKDGLLPNKNSAFVE